jgi:ubiquinone/menaquinone biosynthesis C-methylase UbiE
MPEHHGTGTATHADEPVADGDVPIRHQRTADDVISYNQPTTADDYRRWDDAASWLLGYPFVPMALGLDDTTRIRLLDLGCGPGDLTRWIAERNSVHVIAVDASEAMVELARSHNRHDSVEYHVSEIDRLPFLPDGSMDAAMACFLFTCVSDRELMNRLIAEAARVLRPGGRFTVLVPHPDHEHDVSFEGFHRGEPGAVYRAGDFIPVRVRRRDGSWTSITNTYWPREAFHEALASAGLVDVTELAPVLADAHGVADPELIASRGWTQERSIPPFLLLTATR